MPAVVSPQREATPVEIVIDNRDPGFSSTGWWFVGDGGTSYGGDCAWAPRGIQNIAYVDPQLATAGAYEVYAWWCGDPNHDQSQRACIQIYPARSRVAPYQVHVDLQVNAGRWNSLGIYYLERTAFLSVDGSVDGNAIADAFRLVYRSPERLVVTPTPLATQFPWSGQPPSPIEQLTSGDLHARLGLVGRFYPHTPIVSHKEATFDDCEAFPREGCGGSRAGWQVVVQYQDLVATYRVSKDYQHAVMETAEALATRQLLYLHVTQGNRLFRVDRYIDDTWHLSGHHATQQVGSHLQLEADAIARLRPLVQAHGTVGLATGDGMRVTLYGLGERAALSDEDRESLAELVSEWGDIAWMRDAIPQ